MISKNRYSEGAPDQYNVSAIARRKAGPIRLLITRAMINRGRLYAAMARRISAVVLFEGNCSSFFRLRPAPAPKADGSIIIQVVSWPRRSRQPGKPMDC